ncbi:hypothetical protein LZ32DRAFT_600974 [Colletotrichum eremochloae]|nr:hypothetical protein LZ32DRAFT_600974 [Colletotrichum eremochloae]
MTAHRGTKTASAGAVAAASLGTAFIDPTGISFLTFLGASAATVVGTTYHAAKGISKSMKQARHQRAEEQAQALCMSPLQHRQFQEDVENTIRKLTASLEGSILSSVLFIGLPYMGILWAIQTAEARVHVKRLKMLADRAGGKKALIKTISKGNVLAQVIGGAMIKTATIAITLGHDFGASMGAIGSHFDNVDCQELFAETGNMHERWLENPVVEDTTEFVDRPQEAMKEFLEEFDGNLDKEQDNWTWKDNHSAESVIALGAVVAAVSKAVDCVLDEPLHNAAEKVGGSHVPIKR